MSYAMLHGLGDCTPERHCGCLIPPVTDNARAETTTATTEDALDSLPYFTFEDDDVAPDEEFVRKADVARLLATARTRPTRTAIARAICESTNPGIPAAWNAYRDQWLQDADAVLALFEGGDDRG